MRECELWGRPLVYVSARCFTQNFALSPNPKNKARKTLTLFRGLDQLVWGLARIKMVQVRTFF